MGFILTTVNQDGKEVLLENVFTLSQICCLLRVYVWLTKELYLAFWHSVQLCSTQKKFPLPRTQAA